MTNKNKSFFKIIYFQLKNLKNGKIFIIFFNLVELKSLLNEFQKNKVVMDTDSSMNLLNQTNENIITYEKEEFWLNSFAKGQFIGDGDRETSGGYADYIVKRLLNEFPNSNCETFIKFKFFKKQIFSF